MALLVQGFSSEALNLNTNSSLFLTPLMQNILPLRMDKKNDPHFWGLLLHQARSKKQIMQQF